MTTTPLRIARSACRVSDAGLAGALAAGFVVPEVPALAESVLIGAFVSHAWRSARLSESVAGRPARTDTMQRGAGEVRERRRSVLKRLYACFSENP